MLKVKIKIADDAFYEFDEEDNTIEALSLNRVMDDDIEALQGNVQAGEVNIQFSNLYSEFNPRKVDAPYKDLKNGQEVRIFNVVSNIETTIFVGYIVDFKAPTSSQKQTCDVRAVDRLQLLLNQDMQAIDLQVEKNMTLSAYLALLFTAYGLTSADYQIDAELLDIEFDYSLITGKSLSEQLAEITKAADCYIYCNRIGKIIVKAKTITGTPVKTYTRNDNSNYLTDSEYGFSLYSSYNALKVAYTVAKLSEIKELLHLTNQAVQYGTNILENLDLNIKNLYELDNVKVSSSSNTTCTALRATASSITLTLENPTIEDDIVEIWVYGKTIETAKANIVEDLDSEMEQSLEVDSVLIQSKSAAETLTEALYGRAIQEIPYITASVEMTDFPIDLGYIVRINDSDVELDFTGYVHSIDIEYDGGGYCLVDLGIKALYDGGEE